MPSLTFGNVQRTRPATVPVQDGGHASVTAEANLRRALKDRQIAAMTHAYQRSGGLVHGDDLARLLRRHHSQPLSLLARWIVSRDIVTVPMPGQTLIPMFQFDLSTATPRSQLAPVLEELRPAFTDWEVAMWFTSPNAWLADHAPVDVLLEDAASVLRAATMDRHVAMGSRQTPADGKLLRNTHDR
ncbi:MAG TPA: hypothetical protein VIO33_01000 [Burkholderiaceae bacterium]